MAQQIDIALSSRLRSIYGKNSAVKSLLNVYATGKLGVLETSVSRAAQLAGVDYREMLQALRDLAEAGAGEFKVGRHGAKSRIVWEYHVRSLAAAARGEGGPIKLTEVEEKELAEEAEDVEEGDVVHEFLLRPGKKIRLTLPSDLTQREAERLGGFIQSLPFDNE